MRFILKFILQFFSRIAIRKHSIELVVVTGSVGAELVKEGIYTVLSEKFITRRNTKEIWWDLSIPLNILGYSDTQRSPLGWLILFIRIIIYLFIGQSNPHILVLSAISENPYTAKYWSSFIKPDYLVVVNKLKPSKVTENLVKCTTKYGGIIIYKTGSVKRKKNGSYFEFGTGKKSKVNVKETSKSIVLTYRDRKIKALRYSMIPQEADFLSAVFSLGVAKEMRLDDIISGVAKFDLRNAVLRKISKKFNE